MERLLRRLLWPFSWWDRHAERILPAEANPLTHTGAIANASLIIAIVSGIVLLFWYTPSVDGAHASVMRMHELPWTAGFARALHRYSADACIFFVVLHAVRMLLERRFAGARWLAWVTGVAMLGVVWVLGWSGYWLVWDDTGAEVARATAKFLDVLPIFTEPLSHSFLADDEVSSLLFFVVFFFHMVVPLALGIGLWLHISRLRRARFLTGRALTLGLVAILVVASIAFPAPVGDAAQMAVRPTELTIDAWYAAPLVVVRRVGVGALWGGTLLAAVALFSAPWALRRRRAEPAVVEAARCNACEQCVADCPYGAIEMVPREDGVKARYPLEARVDPALCVGCGICAGSCDSAGIGIPSLTALAVRRRVDERLRARNGEEETVPVAFVCQESARALRFDDDGRCDTLPGYVAVEVPCIGWVHPLTVERAARKGAAGVLLVACGTDGCRNREGWRWTHQRQVGEREPSLRVDRVGDCDVELVATAVGGRQGLRRAATRFRERLRGGAAKGESRAFSLAVAAVGVVLLAAATVLGSQLTVTTGASEEPMLIVAFEHPGSAEEACRSLTAAELAARPPHMRPPDGRVCERGRSEVRLQVTLDDRIVADRSFEPSGVWGDGSSTGLVRLDVSPGRHTVGVRLGDSADDGAWAWEDERQVIFARGGDRTILFDRTDGFTWHPSGDADDR